MSNSIFKSSFWPKAHASRVTELTAHRHLLPASLTPTPRWDSFVLTRLAKHTVCLYVTCVSTSRVLGLCPLLVTDVRAAAVSITSRMNPKITQLASPAVPLPSYGILHSTRSNLHSALLKQHVPTNSSVYKRYRCMKGNTGTSTELISTGSDSLPLRIVGN